ncbi:AI-2E family transporter [Kamptonema cortianum]|uniref:AI-2E family transporter n=1 Tax=Geitlerinema calcuttense NRMC-F 0142 TaxID=2922238 RepID=A0ABT7LVQ6_9CYAN|nr:AI-2E family transporter [Geitlerinema calcuttense]MDK3155779.1 AI-2E family transporter [Kamptonema cortianum]MDL5056112.1 AI-2E family transporter [Geitlerinema calcuttense NRMC-F 0142]
MNRVFSPVQQLLITWLLLLITASVTLKALSYVGELVSILLSAALIAFLLNYPVSALEKTFLPRSLAATIVYLMAGIGLLLFGLTVVPPVFNQGRQFIANLPNFLDSAQQQLESFQLWSVEHNLPFDVRVIAQQILAKIQAQVEVIATRGVSKGVSLVVGTFNWFLDFILILVISFYMLLDGKRLWQGITGFFSPKIRSGLTESLQRNLQRFISGQFFLGLFMAVTLTLAFLALRVPFFLLFAVFIGAMEIIPFIGATLGIGTVVVLVSFINWWLALKVLIVSVAIQQVKDNAIAPRIMGNLTGLSPVIIFATLLLGAKLGGLLGVILAIPIAGVVKSLVEIILDPTLPPQTGSFFHNPLNTEIPHPAKSAESKVG